MCDRELNRKWLSFSVIALLVFGSALVAGAQLAPGGTFTDDNGNIHESSIEAVYAAGVTAGCGPFAYCPSSPVTRAEMAVFLIRARGEAANVPSHQGFFLDVANGLWYTPSIERLYQLGITTGRADGTFGPDDLVTRAEMATFLVRAFPIESSSTSHVGYFSDVLPTDWYAGFVEQLYERGITTGCQPGLSQLYCPQALVLRDQMASFLTRALGLAPIVPPLPITTNTTLVPTTTTRLVATTSTSGGGGGGGSAFSWSCNEGVFSGWSCSGNFDQSDPSSESWSCHEGVFSGWSCSGNIDKSDFLSESWSCYEGVFSGWSCSGNIDKSDFLSESWSCYEGVFSGWSCSGDANLLAPAVSPVPFPAALGT